MKNPESISIVSSKERAKRNGRNSKNERDLEESCRLEFYNTVRPLLTGLTVVGRLPCQMSNGKKYKSTVRSFSFIYCLVVFILLSCVILEQLYESLTALLLMKFEFSVLIRHCSVLAFNLLLYAPIPLCLLKERNSIPDFINAWPSFLVEVKVVTGHKFHSAARAKIIKLITAIDPILTVIAMLLMKESLLLRKVYQPPAYVVLLIQYHYIGLLCLFSLNELKNISTVLENKINQISDLEPFSLDVAPRVEELRLFWIKLSYLVQQTGNAMSLSIGFYAIITITNFIVSWFVMISSLIHPEYDHSVGPLIIGIFTGVCLLILSEPAHRATEAAGGRIMRALTSIDLNRLDPAASQEIQCFWETVKNNYPHITLSGRTIMNRQWLTNVLANVLTYLIVLVQFQATALSSLSKPQINEPDEATASI